MFDTIELPTWFVAVVAVFASIAAIERADQLDKFGGAGRWDFNHE